MARLISCATGNFTAAGTWAVSDATAFAEQVDNFTKQALSTSYTESAAFTPGAITIDGIVVKLASRASGTPTNTISVRLAQGGALVAGTEVTINVSDLNQCTVADLDGGWYLFKLTAPVLLLAATAYTVSAKLSATTTAVELWQASATAANYARQLRTTTTAAPAAGDVMDVMGEHTGAGTGNDFVVTMNETATTDYGAGTDGVAALTISKRSTLIYGTTAATNYYLKLSGNAIVYNGGTLNIGTTGTPIPRDSTAVLEFDPVADGGMGLTVRNGGTFTSQGLSRTSGKDVVVCKLTADKASGQTVFDVDTDTGWLSGDQVVITKTNRSNGSQTELKVLNGAASATQVTISVATSNSHAGTAPRQARIALLTRNVKIRSATNTLMTFINCKATSITDIRWTEMCYMGENATGKKGIELDTSTDGSFNMAYCSLYGTEDIGFQVNSGANNITVTNNIFYNLNNIKASNLHAVLFGSSNTNITVDSNYFLACQGNNTSVGAVAFGFMNFTFTNNFINDTSGCNGMLFGSVNTMTGTFSNNEVCCDQAGYGIYLSQNGIGGTLNGITSWFNWSAGIMLLVSCNNLTISNSLFFGNQTQNVLFQASGGNITMSNCTLASFSGASTSRNIIINSFIGCNLKCINCSFSQATGSYQAASSDIHFQNTLGTTWLFDNCLMGASSIVTSYLGNITSLGLIAFNKLNQITNNHAWYTGYGVAQSTGTGLSDTNVRTASSLALRIAPQNATTGFSWSFKILARAGTYVSIAGFIQKNATFSTDDIVVDLYLPGSTTPDATQTMPDTTNWEVFNLAASYTGTVDLYATVTITGKTTTAGAYLYVDDLYNGTNKITALDTWDQGQPSPIMFEQLGDASAVWAVLQSTQTTAGTMGNRLKKALTVPLFIGLK